MTKLTYEEFKEAKLSAYSYLIKEYDTPRKLENALKRMYEEYSHLYDLPLVKKIVVNLPYKPSRTWGNIISGGDAYISYVNGKATRVFDLKASGTGYDKGLHVLENVLNDYAKQNLLDYEASLYEEYASQPTWRISKGLDGIGVGADGTLYYSIGGERDYFNFTVEKTADSINSFKQYTVTFKNGATNKMYARKVTAPRKKRASPAKKCPVRVDFRKML